MIKLDPQYDVIVNACLTSLDSIWSGLDYVHHNESAGLDRLILMFGPGSSAAQSRAEGRAILVNAMDLIARAAKELDKLKE